MHSADTSKNALEGTTRSALILYSKQDYSGGIYILLGKSRIGLTTIGGKRLPEECWIECLIREIQEETRSVLDYTNCAEMFNTTLNIAFDQCAYAFCEVSMIKLRSVSERFLTTSSARDVCNELISLDIIHVDTLVEDMLTTKSIRCAPVFTTMFLMIGYDILQSGRSTLGRNYLTSSIGLEADLRVEVGILPKIVCLTPINDGLPIIYGTIPSRGLFITEQFFLESRIGIVNGPSDTEGKGEKRRRLFRSGWYPA